MTLMTPADHRRGWLLALEHEHNDPQRGVLRAGETISDARTDARAGPEAPRPTRPPRPRPPRRGHPARTPDFSANPRHHTRRLMTRLFHRRPRRLARRLPRSRDQDAPLWTGPRRLRGGRRHQRLLGAVAADLRARNGGGQRRPGTRSPRPGLSRSTPSHGTSRAHHRPSSSGRRRRRPAPGRNRSGPTHAGTAASARRVRGNCWGEILRWPGSTTTPGGRPLTAATREPACQDYEYDLMIDPMATGTANRPSGDLRRPRGREALSTHPPTPVDDTPRGSLEQRAENTAVPATWAWERGRDRAPAPRCRHTGHLRPDRRLPRRVLHGRRPRRGSSRRRPQRHRSALPDRPWTARRRLRRLARPPDQRRALGRPARRQPRQPPTVHCHRAHQRGLLRGPRQRPRGRRVHLAAARPSRPAPGRRTAAADPPDQRLRDASSAPGEPMENLTLPEPAAGLWAAKRSIVHAIPRDVRPEHSPAPRRRHDPRSPLEALHQHRHRTCSFPAGTPLIDPLQDNDRNIVNQLGGTPEAVAGGRVKIAFENGFLDISTFRPDPPTATPSPPSTASSRRFSPATRSCAHAQTRRPAARPRRFPTS